MEERIYGPEMNDGEHCFVFGANLRGVHGAGAAKEAVKHWGARNGKAEGPYGESYAIPTKRSWRDVDGLPLDEIAVYVHRFLDYAKQHPEITFLVTRVGCGYAGHSDSDMSRLFLGAPINCVLPEQWI